MVLYYPKEFRDVKIKYKGDYYSGYYEGSGSWRLFTSINGTDDTFICDEDVEMWKESEE